MSDQGYQSASEDVPPSTQPSSEIQPSQVAESETRPRTRKTSKTPLPTIAEEDAEENPDLLNVTSRNKKASKSNEHKKTPACPPCRKSKIKCKHRLEIGEDGQIIEDSQISEDGQVSPEPVTPPKTRKRKANTVTAGGGGGGGGEEEEEEQVEPESQTELKRIKLTLDKNEDKGKEPSEEVAEPATATKRTRGRPRKRPIEDSGAGENEDSNPPAVKRPKNNKAQEQTVSAESGEASTAPARRKNTALRNLEDSASLSYIQVMMRQMGSQLKDSDDKYEASLNKFATTLETFKEVLDLFNEAKQSFKGAKGTMDVMVEKFGNGEN
ncbi:uncharacterized protein KD926_011372 [Aspergillus affinis]|uniref:uncharacterized protein n=1 Tax=Aspergillus affinis TaxID=1070780 RepID=UPI0022FE93EB|nr:uncharacterized protein KD926_011372 [Aspergillus affinis]KAI9038034.1 hypothetical protein KD926_011372 [Aspergillus affinis]